MVPRLTSVFIKFERWCIVCKSVRKIATFTEPVNTMKQTPLLSFFILIVLLVACRSAGEKKYQLPDRQILEKHWKLVSLSGTLLPADEEAKGKEAYMSLKSAENNIEGNGPCNRFRADFALQPNNGIRIQGLSATKLLCSRIELEQAYFAALEQATDYQIKVDTLILYKSARKELAKFLLIYMQ